MTVANKKSQRELSRAKMLEEALSHPGVRETMEVYQKSRIWQEKNQSNNSPQSVLIKPKGKIRAASSAVC